MDMRKLIQKEKTLSFGEGTCLKAGAFSVYGSYKLKFDELFHRKFGR